MGARPDRRRRPGGPWLGPRGRDVHRPARRLRALGLRVTLRASADGKRPLLTDNGNLTLDCAPPVPLADGGAARTLDAAARAIPGVVDTGLFLGTAERVLVGDPDGRVDVLLRRAP